MNDSKYIRDVRARALEKYKFAAIFALIVEMVLGALAYIFLGVDPVDVMLHFYAAIVLGFFVFILHVKG